jgi:hypothetical protein
VTFEYIADMVFFVHDFTSRALAHVCADEGVCSDLWSVLQEQLVDRYHTAIDYASFIIIQVERSK